MPARSQVAPRSRVVVSQPSPGRFEGGLERVLVGVERAGSIARAASRPPGRWRKQTTRQVGDGRQRLEVVGLGTAVGRGAPRGRRSPR